MSPAERLRLCTVARCREGQAPRVVSDGGFACRACAATAAKWLGELPALWAELTEALVIGGGGAAGRVPPGGGAGRWPMRAEVAEARRELADWLVAECGMWRMELRIVGMPEHSPGAMALFLASHVEQARRCEWFGASADALRHLRGHAKATLDAPGARARLLGPCPDGCGGFVWAQTGQGHGAATSVECRGCSAKWPTEDWVRLARRIRLQAFRLGI